MILLEVVSWILVITMGVGILLFFKSISDNRCIVLDDRSKVDRYVIKERNCYVNIKDNKKGWRVCEFMTGDTKLDMELAELCLEYLENKEE